MSNTTLIQKIETHMQQKSTDELLDIWTRNDRDRWSEDAFTAVRRVLTDRGVTIPVQNKPPDVQGQLNENFKRCPRCGRIQKRRVSTCGCGHDFTGESNLGPASVKLSLASPLRSRLVAATFGMAVTGLVAGCLAMMGTHDPILFINPVLHLCAFAIGLFIVGRLCFLNRGIESQLNKLRWRSYWHGALLGYILGLVGLGILLPIGPPAYTIQDLDIPLKALMYILLCGASPITAMVLGICNTRRRETGNIEEAQMAGSTDNQSLPS